MKKLLLSAAVLLAAFASQAQTKVFMGPKAGLNVAMLTNDSSDPRIGASGGFFTEFSFPSTVIGLQPEVVFSMQGNKFSYGGVDYATRLGYINVPVLLKIYFIDNMCIEAGPQVGFLVSSKIHGGGEDQDLPNINAADLSIAMGLSYNFNFGLMLSARYNIGVTDIRSYVSQKNGVFQFSAGWRFGVGKNK